LALLARDARFDGQFFTGVTSTGIYCRPVCKVRTPKPENCRFFDHAAQAEAAGFRPCLRCRPELAPAAASAGLPHWSTQDASALLAVQAARLMDQPLDDTHTPWTAATVAARLGVSDRHLRRIFEAHWGISPLRFLQTRRLLTAKQLLTDTSLPVHTVAELSGYASVRRFHAVFSEHYRLQPLQLRHAARRPAQAHDHIRITAAYRPPYDIAHMLRFFADRALAGVEWVDVDALRMRRTVRVYAARQALAGVVDVRWLPAQHRVALELSASLAPSLPFLLRQIRAWLDLDADLAPIDRALVPDFANTEGMRVPGCLDGFELAVRAILGQQVTVQAARTLCNRVVRQWGVALPQPVDGLSQCFPDAATLAGTTGEAWGALGIVKQRQSAILSVARLVADGTLVLTPGAPLEPTLRALLGINGIGPWTAQYIAMRALRAPDAFPSGDVALHAALGLRKHPRAAQEAEALSTRWMPWRAYATVRAWHQLATPEKLSKT
jgi:AraC family transcriptional regulator of adaptative response / DNA-3-methyladenine glycosylase II